jgi:hypothetical protein
VVRHYETTQRADDEARWRIFVRRAEALYALASELHDPEETGGLAGGDWARAYLRDHRDGRIELRRYTDKPGERNANQYLLARRGNFGQFYVRSMTEVGLLQPTTGVPLVSRPRGEALADAFGTAIGSSVQELIADTLSSGRLDFREARTIGKAIHPSSINGGSKEMRLLRDFLLANALDAMDGTARRSSAWLLLDLVRRGVSLDDEGAIRRAFYHRLLPGNKPYDQSGQIIDRWRIYQANEQCHVALEIWLNAVALKIDSYSEGVAPAKVIDDLISGAFKSRELRGTWHDWASVASTANVAQEEKLTEVVLQALRNLDHAQENIVLQAAISLLAILWVRWSGGAGGVRDGLQRYSEVSGRSLANVLASFDACAASEARMAVAEVLQEHIVESHLIIAARKLAGSNKFTYRFTLSDGVLSDGISTNYGFTNPRLKNLGRFLRDAKLCMGDTLTAAGEKFLDENKPS